MAANIRFSVSAPVFVAAAQGVFWRPAYMSISESDPLPTRSRLPLSPYSHAPVGQAVLALAGQHKSAAPISPLAIKVHHGS